MSTAKTLSVLALLLSATAASQTYQRPREIRKNRFGATEIIDFSANDNLLKKRVSLPLNSYIRDYSQQAQFIKEAEEQI